LHIILHPINFVNPQFAQNGAICPVFLIPAQTGSDTIPHRIRFSSKAHCDFPAPQFFRPA